MAGQSGIVHNDRFDVTDYAAKVAGLVPSKKDDPHGFDANDLLTQRSEENGFVYSIFDGGHGGGAAAIQMGG